MTIWYASELGWTSGQNVSSDFKSKVQGTFKSGDTLVVDTKLDISGSFISLPNNFTMIGKDGGGFNVLTEPLDRTPLFVVKDGTTIENMTFTADQAPNAIYTHALPKVGEQYHGKHFLVVKGDNVTISDSSFSGNVGLHIDVSEAKNVTIESSEFEGGFYQVRVVGGSDNFTVIDSYFHDALGDGIKTERFEGSGPQNISISGSLFENNNRDGIDTAGGFYGGSVTDSVFYNNSVSALDIKKVIESDSDLSTSTNSENITLDGNTFVVDGNGIVFTFLDRIGAVNSGNADQFIPHDISITNSIFEGGESERAFLIKDGHNITWDNLTFYGGLSESRVMNINAPSGWSPSNVGGEYTDGGAAKNFPVTYYWSKDIGPSVDGPIIVEENIFTEIEQTPSQEETPQIPPTVVDDGELSPAIILDIKGDNSFTGGQNQVIEIAPTDALKTETGNIQFRFNANTVQSNMGLVSRDAAGSDAGSSHFTSYIKAGSLYVRFQNGDQQVEFKKTGLKANQDYDVKASFGNGKVALWLDDVLIGEENMVYSWLANEEYLQIGANGWASTSGSSGFRDVFQGTISDILIAGDMVATPQPEIEPEQEEETPPVDVVDDPIVEDPVEEPVEEPVEDEPVEEVYVAPPKPVINVNPITGDNVLSESERNVISVTGSTENMEDGSWVNVVLWHGASNYAFAGSAQVNNDAWSLSGIDVSILPAGERFSVIATAENESGFDKNWTTFTIEEVVLPTHAFVLDGDHEFDGFKSTVLEFQHTSDFNLEDAAVSFNFNADVVNKSMGLISKDAFGRFQNDGHFVSFIDDGNLYVRFQEDLQSKTLTLENIEANKNYTVTTGFQDGKVSLYVNGNLEDEALFDFDWLSNREYLQIGANGWASRSGQSGFRDEFDGTIENVVITDLSITSAFDIHASAMQDTLILA